MFTWRIWSIYKVGNNSHSRPESDCTMSQPLESIFARHKLQTRYYKTHIILSLVFCCLIDNSRPHLARWRHSAGGDESPNHISTLLYALDSNQLAALGYYHPFSPLTTNLLTIPARQLAALSPLSSLLSTHLSTALPYSQLLPLRHYQKFGHIVRGEISSVFWRGFIKCSAPGHRTHLWGPQLTVSSPAGAQTVRGRQPPHPEQRSILAHPPGRYLLSGGGEREKVIIRKVKCATSNKYLGK